VNLLEALGQALRIDELRKKILFTLGLLVVFRVLASISYPDADKTQLYNLFNATRCSACSTSSAAAGWRRSASSAWG